MGRFLERFRRDDRANVAIIFALSALPLFSFVGMAVDYGRMSAVQAKVQAALDAAALSVARQAGERGPSELSAIATREFRANLGSLADTRTGTIAVARDNTRVTLALDTSVDTNISGVMGIRQLDFRTRSSVAWRQPRIELTLVLDNTGSMGQMGKMPALQQATRDLLRDLEALRTFPGQVKVAIVPFDTQVNVGVGYRNANWIRFDDAGLRPGEGTTQAAWAGCLTDRDQPHDVTDAAPVSEATRYRAARCGTGSLAAMRPLTDDFAALRTTIASMQPSGYTNITMGLQMGLAVATPAAPFQDAYTGPDEVLRYMVLLTDGDNTMSRYVAPNGNSAAIDARTRLACQSVKDAGVTLFTVRVIAGNANLLRDCASNPGMYYGVDDAAGISAAFRSITRQISRLRLTS